MAWLVIFSGLWKIVPGPKAEPELEASELGSAWLRYMLDVELGSQLSGKPKGPKSNTVGLLIEIPTLKKKTYRA